MVDVSTVSHELSTVSQESDVADGVRSEGEVLGVMLAAGADATQQGRRPERPTAPGVPAAAVPTEDVSAAQSGGEWHDTLRLAAEATMDGRAGA